MLVKILDVSFAEADSSTREPEEESGLPLRKPSRGFSRSHFDLRYLIRKS
jgi:hypothetical protein